MEAAMIIFLLGHLFSLYKLKLLNNQRFNLLGLRQGKLNKIKIS